tara:strand:+ start:241 stop:459 length:219 start_codon:yes stop_codon:yes gene_type:complete
VEAASAVPRVKSSEVCTSSALIETGTAMVTVMSMLAAALWFFAPRRVRMVTSNLSTPAASANFRFNDFLLSR